MCDGKKAVYSVVLVNFENVALFFIGPAPHFLLLCWLPLFLVRITVNVNVLLHKSQILCNTCKQKLAKASATSTMSTIEISRDSLYLHQNMWAHGWKTCQVSCPHGPTNGRCFLRRLSIGSLHSCRALMHTPDHSVFIQLLLDVFFGYHCECSTVEMCLFWFEIHRARVKLCFRLHFICLNAQDASHSHSLIW